MKATRHLVGIILGTLLIIPSISVAENTEANKEVSDQMQLAQKRFEFRQEQLRANVIPAATKGARVEPSCDDLRKRLELIHLEIDLLNEELQDPSLSPQEKKHIKRRIALLQKLVAKTEKEIQAKC